MKTTLKRLLFVIVPVILIAGGYFFFVESPFGNQSSSDALYVYEEEVDSAEDCTEFEIYQTSLDINEFHENGMWLAVE